MTDNSVDSANDPDSAGDLHTANGQPQVGTPGAVLICVGAIAFVACIAGFSLGIVPLGTWAGIVALLTSAAGLAWLTNEGRRQRGSQPLLPPAPRISGSK